MPTVVDEDSSLPLVGCSPASGSTFPVGTTTVTCTVTDGDDTNSPVSQSFTVTVQQLPTTTQLASSANPSVVEQQVTFTATVSPVPDGGTVAFKDGSSTINGCGTQPVNNMTGKATCATSSLGVGSHSITAIYSGDAGFTSSTSTGLTQTVQYGVTLLYKPTMGTKAGSTVAIKLELQKYVNGVLANASSAGLGLLALCVVPAGGSSCTGAVISYSPPQPFTFDPSLASGGGYQFKVKTLKTMATGTHPLLFQAAGEASTTYHAEAGATFTISYRAAVPPGQNSQGRQYREVSAALSSGTAARRRGAVAGSERRF